MTMLTKKEILLLKLLIGNFILNSHKYFEEDSRNPAWFQSVWGAGYKFTMY